jgi:hypothetical protein
MEAQYILRTWRKLEKMCLNLMKIQKKIFSQLKIWLVIPLDSDPDPDLELDSDLELDQDMDLHLPNAWIRIGI